MGGGPSILGLNYFLMSAIMSVKQLPVGFLSLCPDGKEGSLLFTMFSLVVNVYTG
jgi:hypothetical protein